MQSDKILDEPKTPFTNPRILRNGDHFESRSAPPNKRYNDGGSFGHDDRVNFQYHDIKNHDEWRLSSSHRNSQYGRGYISPPPSLYSDVNRQMAVNYRVNPHYQPDFGRNYHNYHPDAGYRAVPRFNNNPANRHWNQLSVFFMIIKFIFVLYDSIQETRKSISLIHCESVLGIGIFYQF